MSAAAPLPAARAQALRLLVGMVIVTVVGVAGGLLAGGAVWDSRPPEDDLNPWSDLGFALGALAVGLVVGGVVYLIGLVIAVRRTVPRGRRLTMAFAILAVDALLMMALSRVAGAADRGGMPALGAAVGVGLAVTGVAGLGLLMDAIRPRVAGWISGVTGAGFLVLLLLSGVRAESVAASERAARYEASGAPLALVDGRDLSVPTDGWEVARVGGGWARSRVTVTFDVSPSGGEVAEQVTLDLDPERHARRCEREPEVAGRCIVLGRVTSPDDGAGGADDRGGGGSGGEIVGERITGEDGGTTFAAVWVDVPGGRWTIWGSDVDEADAVAVLRSLEPVDAATFTAAT